MKDWEKFHSEFKKLMSTADCQTDPVASSYLKQITQSKAACNQGKDALTDALKAARKGRVTGKMLEGFQTFKEFAAACKTMEAALTDLRDDINGLATYFIQAQKISIRS